LNKENNPGAMLKYHEGHKKHTELKSSGNKQLFDEFFKRMGKNRDAKFFKSFNLVLLARSTMVCHVMKKIRYKDSSMKKLLHKDRSSLWDQMKKYRGKVDKHDYSDDAKKKYKIFFDSIWKQLMDSKNTATKELWLACKFIAEETNDTTQEGIASFKKEKKMRGARRSRAMNTFFRWMNFHYDNIKFNLNDEYYNGNATSFVALSVEQAKMFGRT